MATVAALHGRIPRLRENTIFCSVCFPCKCSDGRSLFFTLVRSVNSFGSENLVVPKCLVAEVSDSRSYWVKKVKKRT